MNIRGEPCLGLMELFLMFYYYWKYLQKNAFGISQWGLIEKDEFNSYTGATMDFDVDSQ